MAKHPQDNSAPKHEEPKAEKAPEFTYPSIVEEQRARSEEIQKEGVTPWVMAHDDRPEDEQPELHKKTLPIGDTLDSKPGSSKQVHGITHPTTDKVR